MDEKPRHRRFRFGLRTLFEIIAVVAFILTLLYYRQTSIQNTGRYSVQTIGGGGLIIDTQTGQLWEFRGTDWVDHGRPPVKSTK